MFMTSFFVLLIFWLFCVLAAYTVGGLIHLALLPALSRSAD
jgi:hypothetical protein